MEPENKKTNGGVNGANGFDNPGFVNSFRDPEKHFSEKPPEYDEQSAPVSEKDEEDRVQWGNGLEFLMSCIAMSVGLGNIWRFPFTAKENGGGAFLIPYIIVLTVIGRPMYYMEMVLGQFSSRGNVKMYEKLSPVLKCIGFGQLIATICVATYYCCLMAITLVYFINSFTGNLPWSKCQDSWTDYEAYVKRTCVPSDGSRNISGTEFPMISSSELWFRLEVLKAKDNISDGIGLPDWRLTVALLVSWLITYGVSIRGVKSSGKASYFLALFPYVIMFALLIRAATLEGAGAGMKYFIETDWNKLLQADVWYAAVTQCFFSLNVGFGSIIMYSSYNSFEHNVGRDALVVTTLDTFTSLLAGSTIFGILGNLAHNLGQHPSQVSSSGGTGLAFISYPDAIAKFTFAPWLFAILFFMMLFVLGVGSLVALQGCVNTVIADAFPKLQMWIISAGSSAAMFLIGLLYCTPGGQYVLELVDHFGGTFVVFIFAILEVLAVVLFYGLDNFCLDLEYMTKKKVNAYWRICWGLITPTLLIIIFIYFLARLTPMTYSGLHDDTTDLRFPPGLEAFGWCILAVGVVQALIWINYCLLANFMKYPGIEGLRQTLSTETWGPASANRREGWKKFKEEKLRKRAYQPNWWKRKLKVLWS